jgi:hypothetical protein
MTKRTESVKPSDAGVIYHPESDVYRVSFDPTPAATTGVVSALAEVRHCDPTEITPLYDAIDTDALDSLIAGTSDADVRVDFVIDGFEITVRGDNTVEIVPPV